MNNLWEPLYERSRTNINMYNSDADRKVEIKDDRILIDASISGTELAKLISDYAKRELVEEMKKEVKQILYNKRYNSGYSPSKIELQTWIIDEIKDVIRDNKEEIIMTAARELADSMRRSKPVRERFCDELEEELNK